MIVEVVERAGTAQQGLRRATIDPSLPQKDYAILESRSDRLEHLSATDDLSGPRMTARRCRAHYVTGDELEPPDRELLRWAQKAVDIVLDSGVYADGLLNQATVKAELAEKEWAIATDLRRLSELRSRREEVVPDRPLSDEAKGRLRTHVRDECAAAKGIGALVTALASRADHVEYADSVYEDLQDREALGWLGNQLRDLIAGVSARTGQSEGVTDLQQQSDVVFGALRELDERTDRR